MDKEVELIQAVSNLTKLMDVVAKQTECLELLKQRIDELEKDVYNEA